MSRYHRRGEPTLRRETIRLCEPVQTETGFEFEGVAEGGAIHRFVISRDTLLELTGAAGVRQDSAPAFERHRVRIYSVAARIFAAGVRDTPIQMKAAFFGAPSH